MHITDKLLFEIYAQYKSDLANLTIHNPRLMIMFSGPPNSGKTTLAKALEVKFQGIRLENDAIRVIGNTLDPHAHADWKSELAYRFMDYSRLKLLTDSPNGLWIVDASIDRQYDKHVLFAKEHGFSTLLIAMRIPKDVRKRWIIATTEKADIAKQQYLQGMDRHQNDQDALLAKHKADLTVSQDYNLEQVLRMVQSALHGLM